MRHLNYSSGIVCVAFALLCYASTAFAATVNLPKSDWVIGPINATSSSGVGYCSMKNDYSDGNTLVFARDAEGSNSLAIDFHKKIMEPGGQYLVSLQVGPLQRQMMAIAATPSIFIIQMGLDRDFYTQLQRKANLLVDFQTSKMSFKLDGTKDGLAALTNCAVAVGSRKKFAQVRVPLKNAVDEADLASVEPAAGGDTPVLPAPVVQPQTAAAQAPESATSGVMMGTLGGEAVKATLEQQIDALKAENRKLLAENQRVAERMQADDGASEQTAGAAQSNMLPEPPETSFTGAPATPATTDVTAALTQAQQGIEQALQASQAQADLARRQADLEAENARLKAQLDAAQAQAEAARKQAAALAENARLKLALAEQQRQLQQAAAFPSLNAAETQAAAPAPEAPKSSPAKVRILAQKDNFLPALLAQSNIDSRRAHDSYAWHAEGIRGEAREEKLDDRALEEAVDDYVTRHAKSCRGDFAHTVRSVKAAGADVMEGELACIHKNGHSDAASAVLFIAHHGKFDIISQGGAPDHMEKALSARDAMVAAISE